jgi:hypothetical protein
MNAHVAEQVPGYRVVQMALPDGPERVERSKVRFPAAATFIVCPDLPRIAVYFMSCLVSLGLSLPSPISSGEE